MNAVVRVTMLHLRTVAPYRTQALLVLGVLIVVLARNPVAIVPALALLFAPLVAVHPFVVADKSDLKTLYATLPLSARALLLGHYAWALTSFLSTIAAGSALELVIAHTDGTQLTGRTLITMLTLSWALFALNIAIQLPLLVRFGYARVNVLATTMPLALIMVAVLRLHLTLTSVQVWLPLIAAAGVAAVALSVFLATYAPRRAG